MPCSPNDVPGCFSFLRRKQPACACAGHCARAAPARAAPAPPAAPLTRPRLPSKHQHFDVCACSSAFAALDGKAAADIDLPPYVAGEAFSSDVRATIRTTIDTYTDKLTALSLFLSDHPELGFHEFKAADKITAFLEAEGFAVERKYKGLETAFRASYTHGTGGRTFAFNSEYDALPEVGHACGHNLIAIGGIAATLGVRAALKKHGIDGTVTLIGTPAEEGGCGKGILIERDGYKGIDGCMMIHPGGTPDGKGGLGLVVPTLAIQTVNVEFFGSASHAAGAPWDGINALDAVNIAYTSVSALRQQMHPTDRVHGIITHGGDAPNVIPDYTSMKWLVRAQSAKAVNELVDKMSAIFDAAAKATGCKVKYSTERIMYELRNNLQLSEEFASAMADSHLPVAIQLHDFTNAAGSTDFGNVTYEMPACHPMYSVPSVPGRSNHTREFRDKCRTPEAHEYTFKFAAGMACAGARFLADAAFADEAKAWWQGDMKRP